MFTIDSIAEYLHSFEPVEVKIRDGTVPIYQFESACGVIASGDPYVVYVVGIEDTFNIAEPCERSFFVCLNDGETVRPSACMWNYALVPQREKERLVRWLKSKLQVEYRIMTAERVLGDALYKGAGLEDIVQMASELLGNPVIVQDSSTKRLLCSQIEEADFRDDEILTDIIEKGFVSADLFKKYDYPYVLKAIQMNPHAFELTSELKRSRIIAGLHVRGHYFGWVLTVCARRAFFDGDLEIMDALANVLRQMLEKEITEAASTAVENVLLDLLNGHINTGETFEKRTRGFGFDRGGPHRVLLLVKRDRVQSEGFPEIMRAYKNHLLLLFPGAKIVYYEKMLVCLMEDMKQAERSIGDFLEHFEMAGVVSAVFHDVLEMPLHYRRCKNIVRAGLHLRESGSLVFYEDAYIYHCLAILQGAGDLESCILPQLMKVIRYDGARNVELASTVREYLKTRNVVTTAKNPHMHRNTLLYRLGRFAEITGLNLYEGEDIYKLWLSFMALDLMDESGNGEAPAAK